MTTEQTILNNLKLYKNGLTLDFLCREMKATRPEIVKALNALLDKGLIKKEPQINTSYKYKLKELK